MAVCRDFSPRICISVNDETILALTEWPHRHGGDRLDRRRVTSGVKM